MIRLITRALQLLSLLVLVGLAFGVLPWPALLLLLSVAAQFGAVFFALPGWAQIVGWLILLSGAIYKEGWNAHEEARYNAGRAKLDAERREWRR